MSKISLVVVDDHTLFRRGLVGLLSEMADFVVVGEADNGKEALVVIEQARPDLVLMDINMPGMNGVEALRAVRQSIPAQKVLMLTISQNDEDLLGAIIAGANGYLLKNAEPEVLRNTIHQVIKGNSVLSPEMTQKVFESLRRAQQGSGQALLSSREIDVLRCMAKGLTTRQIADTLFISENTVKTHIRHILEKFEVNNRAQAVAKGLELKLI